MKKRYGEPINHKSIKQYDFYTEYITTKEYKGHISLIDINKVKDKWFVSRKDNSQVCILDDNYKWLIFHPDNQKYAITALYDQNNKIIEWYFDMVKELGEENGMPYMLDLYLDLVITPENEIYVLDEDELLQAVKDKDITNEDYKLAHNTLDFLLKKYDNGNDIKSLQEISDKYLENCIRRINRNIH